MPGARTTPRPDRLLGNVSWLTAAIVIVLLASVAAATELARTPRFRATTLVAFDQRGAVAAGGSSGIISKLVELRRKYELIVESDTIAGDVARTFDIDTSTVSDAIRVDLSSPSLILRISAEAPNRDTAASLASAAGHSLVEFVRKEHAAANIDPREAFTADVVVTGRGTRIVPSTTRALFLGLSGALLGTALASVALVPVMTVPIYGRGD